MIELKILNKFKIAFLSKAYTEGLYSDTPANRKLGRVGMSYIEYNKKLKDEGYFDERYIVDQANLFTGNNIGHQEG